MATATHPQGHYGADRGGRPHEGCDFSTPIGTPLYNTTPVKVMHVLKDPNSTGGQGVIVRDQYGTDYYYGHLDNIPKGLKPGQDLEPGTLLGKTGNSGVAGTGKPYAPHLHFEAWPGGKKPTRNGGTSADPESIDPNTGKPYLNVTTYNLDKDGNPINNLRTGDSKPSTFAPGRPLPEPSKKQPAPSVNSDKQKRKDGLYTPPKSEVTPSGPSKSNDPVGDFMKQRGLIRTNDVWTMHPEK